MKNRKLSALLKTPREAANQFPLLRRFSITSLVAMLITAAILVLLYRQDQLSEHEEVAAQNNEKTAIHLMLLLDDQINTLITTSNGFDTQALQANPNIDSFTAALEKVREHDMLKLKIYNLSGTAIYSSARGEIGATSKHPVQFDKALSGEVVHRLDLRDTFSGATGELHDAYISATYMLLVHEGKRIGVIEVYADATPFFKRLHATLFQIFLMVFGVFAVLYAALFLFLLRADRAIAEWQKAIIDSEERFRKITESAQDAIIMMGADQRILFWNAAAERIFAYTAAEAMGQDLHALITPTPARAGFAQAYPHFQETGGGPIIGKLREVTALRKNGEEFPVELSVSATLFGGQWHAIGIVRDITGRKRAEKAIAQLQLQQEQILNSAGVGLHGIDLQGNIAFENPAAVAMLGWSAQELVGHHAHSMMHHTRADGSPYPSSECPIYATLHDGATHSVEDEVFWRKDGTCFPVAYVCTPMKNGVGELVGAIVSFQDITERKLMEKNTAEQLDELRRWHKATSGREDRILDLKHEVNELLVQAGQPPRYPSAE